MHKRLAAVAIALCIATAALALDIPPKPTAWVTDNANILTPEQEQSLNEKLEALKTKAGTEFLVMTFPSLEGEDVTAYTNRVVEQWKVKGDKALIIFVFANDRKMRIQVGYGLEAVITDAYASRVYRNTLVPAFRQGRYYEGIDEAITQLGQKVDPTFSPQSRSLPPSGSRRAAGSPEVRGRDIFFFLLIVFIFIVIVGPIMRRRGGCGGCHGCFWPMFFWPGGGGGTTFGGGRGGGGSNWSVGGSWGGGGGSSFGGGGAGGGW